MTCDRLEKDDLLADLNGTLDPHVTECEDCRAKLGGYQRIAQLIGEGATAQAPPADWRRRTIERVHRSRAQRRRRTVIAAACAAAAAIVLLLIWLLRPQEPKLTIAYAEEGGWRGGPHPSQELRAKAEPGAARHFEIRVYQSARTLLARCPGAELCRDADGSLLVWRIPAAGSYQVLLLVSDQPIAPPQGSFEDDVAAATRAGARVVEVEKIDVY